MRRSSKDQNYKDPVCGMQVSHLTATYVYDYNGKTYYFCAKVCNDAFQLEPEKFIHHHRQHGMRPK